MTKSEISKALSEVTEKGSDKDIVTLGRVSDIQVDQNKVSITLKLPTTSADQKSILLEECTDVIKTKISPEADVYLHFESVPPPQNQKLGQLGLPNVKHIIAVASGKGGVGKSSVATNLATALAIGGSRVGLLDTDIYGPSVPLMMGIKDKRPMMRDVNGANKIVPLESHGVKIISIGNLIDEKQAVMWRGPMASSALKQFITDVDWGDLDYLILDLPPGTGDIHLTLLQNFPLSGGVIVTTPQKVATSDTRKGIMMFETPPLKIPILGLVENMSYFIPPDMPEKKYYIFGEGEGKRLAEQFEIPFLGEVPIYQDIQQGGDLGSPAVLNASSPASAIFLDLAEQVKEQMTKAQVN